MSSGNTQASIATMASEQAELDLAPPAIAEAIRRRLAIYFTRRATLNPPGWKTDATQAALYWRRAGRPDVAEVLDPFGSEDSMAPEDLQTLVKVVDGLRDTLSPPDLARLRFLEGQRSYDGEPILGIFSDGAARFLGHWTHVARLPDWAYGFTLIHLSATLEAAMRADWISPAELMATADLHERHHLTLLGDDWQRAVSPPPHNQDARRGKSWACITSVP